MKTAVDFIPPLKTYDDSLSQLAEGRLRAIQEKSRAIDSKTDAELKSLSQEFESIFVNYLMKSMRKTVPQSGLLNSFSVDMYQSMFDQELAVEVSRKKGLGLAEALYKDLSRMENLIRSNPAEKELTVNRIG